ncbi:hypothetical protein HMPREF1982_03919 [Clostridiales bacterium oral taxon 876 str. F0540]|nr:hypothetical protein HMPREF1982_03919 [Clostridiales bacterium oral taxon 876 str. F0540]
MRKKLLIGVVLICVTLFTTNVFQFCKIRQYNADKKFYTDEVENGFDNFVRGLDYYDGKTSMLSNESAIKNSVSAVAAIRNLAPLSKYSSSKPLSEMLMYLDMYFVMESDEYINSNINSIKPYLVSLSSNLDDEKLIKEVNLVLQKLVSNK